MLIEIGKRFNAELTGMPCIGDSLRDLMAADAVGAQPMLVLTGKGEKTLRDGNFPKNTVIFPDLAFAVSALLAGDLRVRGERRRAAPRCELLPQRGQRSGDSRKRGGRTPRRRAAPRCELLPQRGQRSGDSRKRGGSYSASPGPPQDANCSPNGGSAAATAASAGVVP